MEVAGRTQRRFVDREANRAKGEAIVTDGKSREDGAGLDCFSHVGFAFAKSKMRCLV